MSEVTLNEKEKLLIDYILSSKDLFVKVVGVLKPEYFEKPLDRVVKFTLDYFTKYHALPQNDIVKAETEIEVEEKELSKEEFEYIVDEVEEHCKNEAMRLAILNSIDHLENRNFGAIQEKVREALSVSVDKNLGISFFEDPALRLMMMQQNIDARSVGWKAMDELLDYTRRGEMVIFAGGSGSGKSVVLANVAKNMAKQGLNVLVLTLELAEDLVAKRIDSIVTGIESKEIFDRIDDVTDALNSMKGNYADIFIKKMSAGIDANQLRAYLMEFHLQYGIYPDVICLDYLDLMSPNNRSIQGRFDIDKAVSEELRDVFVEYGIYGFTASQLNRESVGTAVKSQAHIAGGISKINTSDATLAIVRNEEEIDNGEIIFQPIKLRNAEMSTNPVKLFWNNKTLEITDKAPIPKISNHKNQLKSGSGQTDPARDRLKQLLPKKK